MRIAKDIGVELSVRKYDESRYDYDHHGPSEKYPDREPEECTMFSVHLERGTKDLDLRKAVFHVS